MPENLNLVDIASKHLLLHQSRKALKAQCPFHKDDATSLMITPNNNFFKCFGCGAEGGPIEFLMRIERKTRNEIVSGLAKQGFPDAE